MIQSKSGSFLPLLSLDDLQKNYLSYKSKSKKRHQHSHSNLSQVNLQEQLEIKSAFYKKIKCQKQFCKCQFHKRQILFNTKHFQLKKHKNHQQSIPQIKQHTANNQNVNQNQVLQKTIKNHKRFKSLVNENAQQSKHVRNSSLNDTLYKQYLIHLKQMKQANVDCYNIEFEQFLKSKNQWILRQVNKKNSYKNQNSERKSCDRKSSYQKSKSSLNNTSSLNRTKKDNNQSNEYFFNKNSNLNSDGKPFLRKKNKFNTEILSFNKENINQSRFRYSYSHLGDADKQKMNEFLKNICKDLGIELDNETGSLLEKSNLFSELCKNLLNKDPIAMQNAKKALQRISRLPLNLFQSILNNFKEQIKDGLIFPFQVKCEEMQKIVNIALNTLQNNVQEMIKRKQENHGKEKLQIVKKLKNKFTGRTSLNYYRLAQNKNKVRLSSYGNFLLDKNLSKKLGSQKSRFATEASEKNLQGIQQNRFSMHQSQQNNDQQTQIQASQQEKSTRNKSKQIKKGHNLNKQKMTNSILKKIDQQIQFQNNRAINNKNLKSKLQEQYERQRAQNRKKQRDEEARKHLQFLSKMKQKQNQRQQSNMSECQMKKNNLRAHYQRNKLFIKKMQMTLINNQQLKGIVINYEDDLFTKKRKVRILKKVLDDQKQKNTQFYQDIKKYIEIFEKNCNLIIGNDKKNLKKYTKRKVNTEKYFDYELSDEENQFNGDFNDLKSLLKMDNQLKFYLVKMVFFEQEDLESLQTDLSTFISHKVNHVSRHKNILLPTKSTKYQLQNQDNRQILIQTSVQQKCLCINAQIQTQKHELKLPQQFKQLFLGQTAYVENMKREFQAKMEKYNKLLKRKVLQ